MIVRYTVGDADAMAMMVCILHAVFKGFPITNEEKGTSHELNPHHIV